MIIKQRSGPGKIASMHLIGDVKGRDVILYDDMIDSAGTLCKAANNLKRKGAKRIYCFATHGLFNGKALNRIKNSCIE